MCTEFVTKTSLPTCKITASVRGDGMVNPGDTLIDYGSDVRFIATPNIGYKIDSVIISGLNKGEITSYTFSNVQSDSNIRVVFKIKSYTVSASSSANGSISPKGDTLVKHGEDVTYTIVPNTGYKIDSVIVNGLNKGEITSYTFSNVQSDSNIRVIFIKIPVSNKKATESRFFVSPNPTSGKLTIDNRLPTMKGQVYIYNAAGVWVDMFSISNRITELNLSHLTPGIYLLQFGNERVKLLIK